jgi:hypothetical protein
MRRYRERRRREIVLVRLPMLAAGIEAMISTGWLAPAARADRKAIARAIGHLAACALASGLEPPA